LFLCYHRLFKSPVQDKDNRLERVDAPAIFSLVSMSVSSLCEFLEKVNQWCLTMGA